MEMGEKAAFSFSLSFSIKLEETEEKINSLVEKLNEENNFRVARILLKFSKTSHFRLVGQLYYLRLESNSDLGILEEHFFAESSDEFRPQYKQLCAYNDVRPRLFIRFRNY